MYYYILSDKLSTELPGTIVPSRIGTIVPDGIIVPFRRATVQKN